jgi:hypothetical protein
MSKQIVENFHHEMLNIYDSASALTPPLPRQAVFTNGQRARRTGNGK